MYGECFSSAHNYELLYAQSSVEDHQKIAPCKRALFQEFQKSEVKTWETVINALEKSGELNIAEGVKTELHKEFNDLGSSIQH